jgi:hypothetical protein
LKPANKLKIFNYQRKIWGVFYLNDHLSDCNTSTTSIYHGSGTSPENYLWESSYIFCHIVNNKSARNLWKCYFHFSFYTSGGFFRMQATFYLETQGHPEISRGTVVLGIFYMVYFYNNIHFVFYFLLYHASFWLVPGTKKYCEVK